MLIAALMVFVLAQDPATAPAQPPQTAVLEDVEVTAARERDPLDAFSFFESLCFDGNRLGGRAIVPDDDDRWVVLEDNERDRLGIADPSVRTRMLETDAVTLVLRIEERPERYLMRNVCTLSIVGAHDQAGLIARMSSVFNGPGTRRHLEYREDYRTIPGWTQFAWAAIPARHSTDWRVFNPGRGTESGFVVVTEPSFYAHSRYVVGELKYSAAGERPVSVISLTHLFKR